MTALVLATLIGQWLGPNCPTGSVGTPNRPATIRLLVDPPDAEVDIDDHRVQTRGRVRLLESPPLRPGKRYVYHIKARWGHVERQWQLAVEAGHTYELKIEPHAFLGVIEQDGVQNFGIDRSKLALQRERFMVNGQQITKQQACQLLENGSLEDDSHKLRLTVIGSETDRKRVLADLKGSLADLAGDFLVQAYPPDNWAVSRAGFYTAGTPTIYVQDPSGKVLHRQDDYDDGPEGLRKALEAIRKPNPNYDQSRDPDRRKPATDFATLIILGIAGILTLLGLRKGTV
ncbi:MAG: hypothetical protein KatS3mg082_2730 [Nitrospiraceae bacterium]|nr:MAG: hypothetical protein KatS3mg082_2730 [Nitrospiraceae bacterium]GIW81333.1 MAG: hypothetical protein KatS3mg105_3140 [Gemmatales bacterium]